MTTPSVPPKRTRQRPFTSTFGAWSEVRDMVDVSRPLMFVLASLGAAVGLAETVFLAIVASVGIALAGQDTVGIKLPVVGRIEGVSVPALLGFGAVAALVTLAAQIAIVIGISRINSSLVLSLRKQTYRDFVATSWSVQRTEVEGIFLAYIVNYIPRVATVVTAVVSEMTAIITLLVFLTMSVLIAPTIALAVIGLGTVLFIALLPVRTMAKKAGLQARDATSVLYQSFVDAVSASREIKTYGVGENLANRIDSEADALEAPIFKARVLQGVVPAVYIRTVFLILLAGLAAVYFLEINEFTSIGSALLLVLRAMQQAQIIQAQEQTLAESRPWIADLKERRQKFRDNKPKLGNETLTGVESIEFSNVSYTYPNGTKALDNVSFTMRRGELLGVIGPSGSGKSTLSELLVRLERPTEGDVRINGRDAADYDEVSWTNQVTLVAQASQLIEASAADNIRFLREAIDDTAVINAATKAHLLNEIEALEQGFETVIADRGKRGLSGGQKQRLSIARAIVRKPSLVILDEPTSALDHQAEEVIVETMEELKRDACVVVIAHRLSTLRHCDRVLVLREGVVEALCPLDELADQSPFFRAARAGDEF